MDSHPLIVLVMRHAEKPSDVADPDLTPEGQQRAAALADYIPPTFGAPDRIFAAAISKHSARPYETVKPLSKRTGIPINSTVADQDYAALASELLSGRYACERIVVCWYQGNILPLVRELGASAGTYPDPWDPAVFNLILKVEFSAAGPSDPVTEPF